MTAKELEVIHADLLVAKDILYPTSAENRAQNNPQLGNLAIYHSVQAIEKSLKAIIRDGGKMNAELKHTHNISTLLLNVWACKRDFLNEHGFIFQNAKNLTQCNNIRYGDKRVEPYDIIAVYKAARKLHSELQAEYLKDNPDKLRLFSEAEREHKAMDKISFKYDYDRMS